MPQAEAWQVGRAGFFEIESLHSCRRTKLHKTVKHFVLTFASSSRQKNVKKKNSADKGSKRKVFSADSHPR